MAEYVKISEERKPIAAVVADDVRMILCKKRKLCSELESIYSGNVKLVDNSLSSAASVAYGCSEDDESRGDLQKGSGSDLENVDLENEFEGFETEISTPINDGFSILSTPTSELCGDSTEVSMGSSTTKKKKRSQAVNSRRDLEFPAAGKMPSAAEIDEFFAAAEKSDEKRFTEKYNYDFVKDVPLEGRYQWVRLRP